jgi:hypothetical protein
MKDTPGLPTPIRTSKKERPSSETSSPLTLMIFGYVLGEGLANGRHKVDPRARRR